MDELVPVTLQQPGMVELQNYDEVRAFLDAQLERYRHIAYSEDHVKEAKKDKASLNKLQKAIADRRKEIKAAYLAPYLAVEEKLKELEGMIAEPVSEIDAFVKAVDAQAKAEKKEQIRLYFRKNASALGDLADRIFDSNGFLDPKWLNASTGVKVWQDGIREKILDAAQNISTIQSVGGSYTPVLISKYLETQSMEAVHAYQEELQAAESAKIIAPTVDDEDYVTGYKVLKFTGTRRQMAQLMDQLELLGIEYDEIEDGMPAKQQELTAPDFDSFVCFDIETSGSWGVANGDAPAEITEIGAVKVINGQIVDRQDWLCNPGRKIVPRIAKLTHITDDMVKDAPDVATVMQQFVDYIGDLPIVGHNIRNSDLHYLGKAAKKAGIVFNSPFFDTYLYAKLFKKQMGWENVKLEYLSGYFGIPQPSAHRAYCDAEANAEVYFMLAKSCRNTEVNIP